MTNITKLSDDKGYALYVSLPMRLGEDSYTIEVCLEELEIAEINDGNFPEIYEKVKNLMYKKYPPAPVPGWW